MTRNILILGTFYVLESPELVVRIKEELYRA
jgi:hypothetical protein